MRDKHITALVRDSRRIDMRQAEPSLLVAIPDEWHPTYSLHEIAQIEVNRRPVLFHLVNRWTARLAEASPSGALISLYWVNPASRSSRVIDYLRDTETAEEMNARLFPQSPPIRPGGSTGPRATYPSPSIEYGLQAPSQPARKQPQ